jgi:PAS domain S-box-containing protein
VVAATRANQRELLRLTERYRAISATTSDLNIDAEVLPDGSLRVDWISGSLHSASGYTPDDIMTVEQWQRIVLPEDLPLLESHLAAAGAGEGRRTELRARTRDGRVLWLALATCPRREPDSPALWLTTAVRDISARKQAEADTLRSLEENRTLLRELHHRVKNNLQVISSLLNLQSAYVTDERTLDVLRDSQNRVKSMALIHERLYQTRALTKIDFGDYLFSLVSHIKSSFRGVGDVDVRIDADGYVLDVDLVIPCGLIVNELISNSLKHGFPDGRSGEIVVALRHGQDFDLVLTVADDGCGLPADLDLAAPRSLGLQLVTMLTQQVRGELRVERDRGTAFIITFPME